jgi:hypothetical protein
MDQEIHGFNLQVEPQLVHRKLWDPVMASCFVKRFCFARTLRGAPFSQTHVVHLT